MKSKCDKDLSDRDRGLAEAIGLLACAIRDLAGTVNNDNNKAILQRLAQMESNIMSKVSDFAAAQKAYNDRQAAALDSIVASQAGITEDVAELKRLVEELQNSPGEISAEDQALLDELQAKSEETTTKVEAQAAALAALDAQNPPAVPPNP